MNFLKIPKTLKPGYALIYLCLEPLPTLKQVLVGEGSLSRNLKSTAEAQDQQSDYQAKHLANEITVFQASWKKGYLTRVSGIREVQRD